MSADVDRMIERWCEQHLGSGVARRLSRHEHLTQVVGVQLGDGRQVAVKIRDASPRVAACAAVHRILWQRGIPCPQPLAGPAPLSSDLSERMVTAEEWLSGGEVWLGPDAASDYAQLYARMIDAAPLPRDVGTLEPPVPWLHVDHGDPDRIWPPAASPRWDPHRIEADLPALIVEVAVRARRRLLAEDVRALPDVVAHGDYEAQNMRWLPAADAPGGRRPVVLDWDSVVAMPEAVVVGNAAAGFVSPDPPDLATLEQTEQFLTAYQEQRGRRFTGGELQVSYVAGLWVAAYNAAFEHLKGRPGAVTAQLERQAAARMALAGA